MTARWDNIEILQAIDRIQQERYGGGRITASNGMYLMDEINGSQVIEDQQWRGFIQELHIARRLELLTFKVESNPRPNLAAAEPYHYLQTLSDFGLTVKGQDRARGRVVIQPLPDPAEDDGRPISSLILRQVAEAIGAEYSEEQAVAFLEESGALFGELPQYSDEAGHADAVLLALNEWGSEGRRVLRSFLGRWLDDGLISGPDDELHAKLIEQLARQGWYVQEGNLVIGEPARGKRGSRAVLRAAGVAAFHPRIAEAAEKLLKGGNRAEYELAVFASMRAVEIRVRKLGGFGDQEVGVKLMKRAFGTGGPLTDASAVSGEQDGTRDLFAGAYAVLRNPAGHREVSYDDASEAAEAVQTASLLMRMLDRVEDRLIAERAAAG